MEKDNKKFKKLFKRYEKVYNGMQNGIKNAHNQINKYTGEFKFVSTHNLPFPYILSRSQKISKRLTTKYQRKD